MKFCGSEDSLQYSATVWQFNQLLISYYGSQNPNGKHYKSQHAVQKLWEIIGFDHRSSILKSKRHNRHIDIQREVILLFVFYDLENCKRLCECTPGYQLHLPVFLSVRD